MLIYNYYLRKMDHASRLKLQSRRKLEGAPRKLGRLLFFSFKERRRPLSCGIEVGRTERM